MSDDVLIYGDTHRSPTLRHEIPLVIGDPFLYVEAGGRRVVLTNSLERDRLARAAPDAELVLGEELGMDDLIASGMPRHAIALELCARLCARLDLRVVSVPPELPVALADRMRADGVEIRADHDLFEARRRVKSAAELAGIRRAQAAAQAGMAAGAALLREAEIAGDDRGHGPLAPGVPITVDLWPCDEESGCWADMTRTFVVGEPTPGVVEMHRLSVEALERALAAARPGVPGRALFDVACDVFEAAGHPTQRTKTPGEPLVEGFSFSLGHGVGLEVHEAPTLGRTGTEPLVAGDVLAVEPGTSRDGEAARVEDLVLVTEDGVENLTAYPYDLAP